MLGSLEGAWGLDWLKDLDLRVALDPGVFHNLRDQRVRLEELLKGLRRLPLIERHQVAVLLEEPVVMRADCFRVLRDLLTYALVGRDSLLGSAHVPDFEACDYNHTHGLPSWFGLRISDGCSPTFPEFASALHGTN